MTKFSIGDLLVFNRIEEANAARNGNTISNGIIISIDKSLTSHEMTVKIWIEIRWTCYNGACFKNRYTWHQLEEMIDRKTMEWYPA